MNMTSYSALLDDPGLLSDNKLNDLQEVIEAFPFFQSARALELKALKERSNFRYNDALKKAAAHTSDRDILFEYITSKEFNQHAISQRIIQHDESVSEIEVVAEDVSASVSLELESKIKAEIRKAEAILDPDLFEKKVASVEEMVQEKAEDKVEWIDPGVPLEFNKEDKHSFSEWLKLTTAQPIIRTEKNTTDSGKEAQARKFELIDKFIQDKPKITPKEVSEKSNLAKPYTRLPETLMTETLAKVYVAQKNYKKALQAYNILILKYPEKSGFFADQIRAIKKLINKEDS